MCESLEGRATAKWCFVLQDKWTKLYVKSLEKTGPMFTDNIRQAMIFSSRKDAEQKAEACLMSYPEDDVDASIDLIPIEPENSRFDIGWFKPLTEEDLQQMDGEVVWVWYVGDVLAHLRNGALQAKLLEVNRPRLMTVRLNREMPGGFKADCVELDSGSILELSRYGATSTLCGFLAFTENPMRGIIPKWDTEGE